MNRINKSQRIVCICRGGQVRSVCTRFILADMFGFKKVLTCGWEKNDAETLTMLCRWADVILVVGRGKDWGLPTPPEKTINLEIGADVWGHYGHPNLVSRLEAMIRPLVEEIKV